MLKISESPVIVVGIVPVNLFPDKSRDCRLVKVSKCVGIGPDKLLLARDRISRFGICISVSGIVPLNWLCPRFSSTVSERDEKSGNVPVRELKERSRESNPKRLIIHDGISPVKRLESSFSVCKAELSFRDDGMVPVNWFEESIKFEREAYAGQSPGKLPVRLLPWRFLRK